MVPSPESPDPSASPAPSASATPTATVEPSPATTTQPLALDLADIQWRTIVEPFSGDLDQRIEGLFLNADGRVVAWGRDQEWINSDEGQATTSFWTNEDGDRWVKQRLGELGDNEFLTEVAHGPQGYVGIGHANDLTAAWWSPDGRVWSRSSLAPDPEFETEFLYGVAAGEMGFLAVGDRHGSQSAWWSSDGRAWTQTLTDAPAGILRDVVALDDGFLAAGVDTSSRDWNATVWHVSQDGTEWRQANASPALNAPEDEEIYRLWAFDKGFVGLGNQSPTQQRIDCEEPGGISNPIAAVGGFELAYVCGRDESAQLFVSSDGEEWRRNAAANPWSGEPLALWEFNAVSRWGDGMIAVGAGTDWQIRVWLSSDGRDWRPVGEPVDIYGQPAPDDYQREAVDALLVTDNRIYVGGQLETSDGYLMIGETYP